MKLLCAKIRNRRRSVSYRRAGTSQLKPSSNRSDVIARTAIFECEPLHICEFRACRIARPMAPSDYCLRLSTNVMTPAPSTTTTMTRANASSELSSSRCSGYQLFKSSSMRLSRAGRDREKFRPLNQCPYATDRPVSLFVAGTICRVIGRGGAASTRPVRAAP